MRCCASWAAGRCGARRLGRVPELPEVEITARRLDAALRGATIESALAPGINALKTFDPPLHALEGAAITGVRRRGKHVVIDIEGDLAVLVHLMSAGRLQLYDKRASLRDRTSRLLLRIAPAEGDEAGRGPRLRGVGTKEGAGGEGPRAHAPEGGGGRAGGGAGSCAGASSAGSGGGG